MKLRFLPFLFPLVAFATDPSEPAAPAESEAKAPDV
jgi:hypothetical protein